MFEVRFVNDNFDVLDHWQKATKPWKHIEKQQIKLFGIFNACANNLMIFWKGFWKFAFPNRKKM